MIVDELLGKPPIYLYTRCYFVRAASDISCGIWFFTPSWQDDSEASTHLEILGEEMLALAC